MLKVLIKGELANPMLAGDWSAQGATFYPGVACFSSATGSAVKLSSKGKHDKNARSTSPPLALAHYRGTVSRGLRASATWR